MADTDNTRKTPLKTVSLDDKYRLDKTNAYITGIEALVRLPMLQHQRDRERGINTAGFVSGYRGSPLGGVDQAMWAAEKHLKKHNITFVPGVNEDLAATAVRGSQEVGLMPGSRFDGVFGMWYGKGPGLDRSMDAIRHANAIGTSRYGGVLAVAGDDHGAKSSSYPFQSEHLFTSLSMPVLAPTNVQEVLDLGIFGWELSRYCGCWVGLKAITENMDSAISAEIDPQRIQIHIPEDFELPADGVNVRWPDEALAQEKRLNNYKIYAALAFARANHLNRIVIDSTQPKLGIISSGKSYLDVMQALDDLGIDASLAAAVGIRVYKVGMPWPLESIKTHEFATGLDEILVVEEKRSVIEDQLTGQLYNWPVEKRPRVVGEYDEHGNGLLTNLAELTPAMIARVIASRLARYYSSTAIQDRVAFIDRKEQTLAQPRKVSIRDPMYCSGCPHNTSTAVPEGSIAAGGIGCHYMGTFSPNRPAQGFTQMGGEGANWVGIAPFTQTPHIFQNLGDGTYFHSGLLAIRQAIASKVNITYKILYNDAVAMTGGQPLDGNLSVARLIQQLKGEGVERIELVSDTPLTHKALQDAVVNLSHRDSLNSVQKALRQVPGTTVLIYEQTCATEKRRRRKRGLLLDPAERLFINPDVCEGCGDCSTQSNCLSVVPKETEFGRKRQIDQASCNKDFSCVNGFCPSFVSVVGGELKKCAPVVADADFAALPEPELPALTKPWNTLIAGVGGTGVLTVSSVLSMAAHLEGKGVATLNQTGLAQKFGAVSAHLRVAKQQDDIFAVRIPAGEADLLIGCDLIVSAMDDTLAKLHIERSHAVLNTAISPTAEFVSDPDTVFHTEAMQQSICAELAADNISLLDATAIASALFGDPIATNFFMVGLAYQKGLLPIGAEAIHHALTLNRVRVEFNQQAFLWGRRTAFDQAAVERIAGVEQRRFTPLETLDEIVAYRYDDLVGYQDQAYADQYLAKVNQVKNAERRRSPGAEPILTTAVAKALHRIMAYKDEYEVARLYVDGRFENSLRAQFEGEFHLVFYMALPFFSTRDPDTGNLKKVRLGGYLRHIFNVLAPLKILRGTRLDVFGYSPERRLERSLIGELDQTLGELLQGLEHDNIQQAADIVNLALSVRGYGHVKAANYEKYRRRLTQQLKKFNDASNRILGVAAEGDCDTDMRQPN